MNMWVTDWIVLTVLLSNLADGLPTITRLQSQQSKVVEYLSIFGYLPEAEANGATDFRNELPAAIDRFQEMAQIPRTGILDEKTIEMMNMPRCGVTDDNTVTQGRVRRYAHSGSKWEKSQLTWKVTEFSSALSHSEVFETLRQAFNIWSQVTNIHFRYKSDEGPVDIEVRFTHGQHNDGYLFDGRGGVLAHAFLPPSSNEYESISGDLHFDDAERWAVTGGDIHGSQSLLAVAVHEIGHSLGLSHSNVQGSVMWPWTKNSHGSMVQLKYDDILAVQKLYGGKRVLREDNSHYLCGHSVDAIFTAVDGNIYLFSGTTVTMLDPATLEAAGESRLISDVFHGIPANTAVDGAVTYKGIWSQAKSYIFIRDRYYRYTLSNSGGLRGSSSSFSISSGWGLDEISFDSIFKFVQPNMLMFVKGQQYWLHTGSSEGAYANYPRSFSSHRIFQHLNGGLTAAFLHPNSTNYFFKGDQIYRYQGSVTDITDGTLIAMC